MSECLLKSDDCAGARKPLAVVSDEELEKGYGGIPDNEYVDRAIRLKLDSRRWVRCGECKERGEVLSGCRACDGTNIAHVCERHRGQIGPHGAARDERHDWTALSELEKWGFEDMVHAGEFRPVFLSEENRAYMRDFGEAT